MFARLVLLSRGSSSRPAKTTQRHGVPRRGAMFARLFLLSRGSSSRPAKTAQRHVLPWREYMCLSFQRSLDLPSVRSTAVCITPGVPSAETIPLLVLHAAVAMQLRKPFAAVFPYSPANSSGCASSPSFRCSGFNVLLSNPGFCKTAFGKAKEGA